MKTTYKMLAGTFLGHKEGEEFDADLSEDQERRAKERGQIRIVNKKKKEEEKGRMKRIALKDNVTVDSVDLSNLARSVTFNSEHSREDVSGFNPLGTNEYLAGPTEQSLEVEFYGSYGASEVHATLYPIHKDREVVEIAWRPDGSAVVSATNPELRGNVQLYTYGPGAVRGEVETFTATFNAADADGLQFFNAPAA